MKTYLEFDPQTADIEWEVTTGEESLNDLSRQIHEDNYKWWVHPKTGKKLDRNVGELLMLIVSEIAEGMEGDRKDLPDDKLPQYAMLDVELVDALIRILDMLGARQADVEQIIVDKLNFNRTRADHKPENRIKAGGKRY